MSASVRVHIGGRVRLADGTQALVIGRDEASDLVSAGTSVSRRHAVLWLDPAYGWVLDDAGSKNGIYLDGVRVARVVIDRPRVVWLGDPADGEAVTFELLGGPPMPPSPPPPQTVYRTATGVVKIGRAPDNDLVLDDVLVSRHHAELRPDVNGFSIVDLSSHNGTFVDGRRITEAHLTRGSLVSIGRRLFQLVDGALQEHVDTGEIDFAAVGLRVEVNGHRLLDDVSFSLGPRSLLAVLGPTGAGKSTLVKALTGFVPADRGKVLYNGRDLYAAYPELRRRIGYVPQDDILHTDLTVRRALDFAARLRLPPDLSANERAKRVDEVIAELGLTQRANLPIRQLSGGQRKRTSVALELLLEPSLLFLDEPTSGLDPGYEKTVMELLRSLADSGRTVIVVTHSVQSLDVCDRALFLAPGGSTAYFGAPGSVPAYFGVREYADVFRVLDAPAGDWRSRIASGPPTEAVAALTPEATTRRATGAAPSQRGWFGQVSTLARRYVAIIAADRRGLALLVLQAPLLAALLLVTMHKNGLKGHGLVNTQAGGVMGDLVLAVTFVGMTNAIREIVKELPIYRRERATGLSISAYVVSKALVLGVITLAQAAIVGLVATARQGGLTSPVSSLGSAHLELVISLAATGLASMALGLLISTVVSTPDKALVLLPVVLFASFVLASPTLDVVSKPGFHQVSELTATKWGFGATGSVAGFYTLIGRPDCENGPAAQTAASQALLQLEHQMNLSVPRCDASLRHKASDWYIDIGVLGGLTVAQLVLAAVLLRRQDPTRASRRPQGVVAG